MPRLLLAEQGAAFCFTHVKSVRAVYSYFVGEMLYSCGAFLMSAKDIFTFPKSITAPNFSRKPVPSRPVASAGIEQPV